MLNELETCSVLPARDLQRAITYYRDTFGMEPVEERPGEAMYRTAGGGNLLIYETENAGSATNTAFSWMTTDLETEMKALRARGVQFEEYDLPGLKTENGVATREDDKGAWFTDSEGNILSVFEMTRARPTQSAPAREDTGAASSRA